MSDYVYGYDPQEFRRLQEQHQVWWSRTREHLDAADFRAGDLVLDLGCGPGFVSTDLASMGAHVLACDQDLTSLHALEERCKEQAIAGVRVYPPCVAPELPTFDVTPTMVYMRWFLCYLGAAKTEALVRKLPLEAGGRLLVHDYINYRSARREPPSDVIRSVIDTFAGTFFGDIGFALPSILERCGFQITWKRVVALAIAPNDPEWVWPDHFFELHVPSKIPLLADAFLQDWRAGAQDPGTLFYSWPVLQLVAVKT